MNPRILFALPLLVACANPSPAANVATTSASAAPTTDTTTTPAPNTTELTVGKSAPDFDLTASDGTKLSLKSLKGKPVVLYFYPKDETPGCTTEACSFRDGWEALQKSGVTLIGVSTDDDASHKAFADHHKLPFKLVSDPQGTLAKAYGVDTMSTPMGTLLKRQTVVIDKDGNVKKIYRTVDVSKHAQEIQADVSG
jgi:peroxiredoxin Q/BCP